VNAFFVQNEDAFPPDFLVKQQMIRRNAFLETPRLGSTTGHGTRMAIVAAGKTWGIAPNANLHLLKIRGEWNRGTTGILPNEVYATQRKALEVAFDEIQGHVEDRLALDSSAKSVINMSWGKMLRNYILLVEANSAKVSQWTMEGRPSFAISWTGANHGRSQS
jgi:hypothetical protein